MKLIWLKGPVPKLGEKFWFAGKWRRVNTIIKSKKKVELYLD